MFKALCVVALLAGLLALTGRSSSAASPASFTSPLIVAKGKLLNQSSTIGTTTILSVPQTGMYRLSFCGTIIKNDTNSSSEWLVNVVWTDPSGLPQPANGIIAGFGGSAGQFFAYQQFQGGVSTPIEAEAGTPITFTVTQSGPPDTSEYSLYYTVERLQ